MFTETTQFVEYATEDAKVEAWRLYVLIRGGYPLHLAECLADSEADLHTCVELVQRGCDPAIAVGILL